MKALMDINLKPKYPDSDNLTIDYQHIYKPNDDSLMILYTTCKDLEIELKIKDDLVNICELGIGSGFVINNLYLFLKQKFDCLYYGIDININSCLFAQ